MLPAYNSAAYLRDAIDSILNQTYSNFELILLNDGSTDDTEKIILTYSDKRIRYVKNEKNLGLISTLNKGIDLADGEFIARMDADDISLPTRFGEQLACFNETGADVVSSPVYFINKKSEVIAPWDMDAVAVSPVQIKSRLPYENCIAHPSVMIKTEVLKANKYNFKQKGSEDWDLWLRLVAAGKKIVKTKKVLLHYRYHSGSVTQNENRRQRVEDKILAVRRKFILSQLTSFKINSIIFSAIYANIRTRLRIVKVYYLQNLLRFCKRLVTINPFIAWSQYKKLSEGLKNQQPSTFLVFSYSHVGGAERVHADITHAVKEKKPVVLFTGIHKETPFITNFLAEGAFVFNVGMAINYFLTANKVKKLVEEKIGSNSTSKVLGCNSIYFYELAEKYNKEHAFYELLHDYTFDNTDSWTISNIYTLLGMKARIFISGKAMNEAGKMYDFFGFDDKQKEHFRLIVNCTDVPSGIPAKTSPTFNILYIGRNSSEKRPQLAFEIAKRLTRVNPSIQFTFIGNFDKTLSSPMINVVGEIFEKEQMTKYLENANALIVTSNREGFPMVIMEAMAYGAIPVSTPVGDISRHIKDGETGFLLDNTSEETVIGTAVKILSELQSNRDLQERLKQSVYQYASGNFSRERFKKEYLQLFN